MTTRTRLKIRNNGVVHCWCGSLRDFCEDISEFIIPLLDSTIIAEFNDRQITVCERDNADTLVKKFCDMLNVREVLYK